MSATREDALRLQKVLTEDVAGLPHRQRAEARRSRSEEAAANAAPVLPNSARGTILAGSLLIGVTFFGFGAWAALAPLASAVSLPGRSSPSAPQDDPALRGGIVSEVLVRERVTPSPVAPSCSASIRRSRVARRAASAPVADAPLRRPRACAPSATTRMRSPFHRRCWITAPIRPLCRDHLRRAAAVRGAAARSIKGQIELLEQKSSQLALEIQALDAQEVSKVEQSRIIKLEIADVRPLLEKG